MPELDARRFCRRVQAYRCYFHIYFEEVFCHIIRFLDWRLSSLRCSDATGGIVSPPCFGEGANARVCAGSSDPFVEWSIKPNYTHWYRKGGAYGRRARTGVCYNTLFPTYNGSLSPLYFYGTRSELEGQVRLPARPPAPPGIGGARCPQLRA